MVLFPALRQSSEREVVNFYRAACDVMVLAFPSVYLLYFPLVWVLGLWLPDYADSLVYFAPLLPICVFDSKMNITCTTLFKVKREERLLLYLNVAICVLSVCGSLAGAYLLKRPMMVMGAAVISLIVRSLWAEHHFNAELCVPEGSMSVMEIALTAAFVAVALNLPLWSAMSAYASLYVAYLFAYRKRAGELAASFRRLAMGRDGYD